MSRIGRKPIPVPEKVDVTVGDGRIDVSGPNGRLSQLIPEGVTVAAEDGIMGVSVERDTRDLRAKRGLVRALVANMVTGVTKGFSKTLELVGTGYKVEASGSDVIEIDVGFSHKVVFQLPEGINADIGEKNLQVTIRGADKQLVGQVAADIRGLRPPEPYKGKGIRYLGEVIRMKAGKAGKAAT